MEVSTYRHRALADHELCYPMQALEAAIAIDRSAEAGGAGHGRQSHFHPALFVLYGNREWSIQGAGMTLPIMARRRARGPAAAGPEPGVVPRLLPLGGWGCEWACADRRGGAGDYGCQVVDAWCRSRQGVCVCRAVFKHSPSVMQSACVGSGHGFCSSPLRLGGG